MKELEVDIPDPCLSRMAALSSRRWQSGLAGAALLVGIPVLSLPSAAQQTPVFEAETTLMEVEVRVTDGRRRPVADLTREDFELLENGRPQRIATFEFVPGPVAPVPADQEPQPQAPTEDDPVDAATKLRRSTFIYIATRGRREDRPLIHDAVSEFIDESLAPGVLVSLEGAPFTSRRSELHETLNEMMRRGGGVGGFVDTIAVDLARDFEYSNAFEELLGETNDEFEDQLEEIADRAALYRRLRMYEYIDLIRALSIYPGRKIVVLFSTGLPVDEDNIDIMKVLEDEATRARVRFFVSDVSRLTAEPPGGDAESASNANGYFGDPLNNGFATQAERRQDNQDGLYELATRTGGRAVLNSNDFGEVFDVVNRETNDYYLLGYYPEDTEQRGRLRRIRVRVQRPGLRVSHQRRYFEERPFEMTSRAERNLRLHQALTFDTPYTDLPIRVDHEYFQNSAGDPTLVYSVGLHVADIPADTGKKGETLKLTVVAQASALGPDGQKSRIPSIDERQFELTVAESALERASEDPNSWLHYGSQMHLRPGNYDWKVVVREDVSGLMGSYQTTLRIPQFEARIGASSLLLTGRIGEVGGARSKKPRKNREEDVLSVDGSRFFASAVKEFRKGEPIFALYDVYNATSGSLETPPGPKMALYRGQVPVAPLPISSYQAVPEPSSQRLRYLAALATDELPAGDYLIAAMLPTGAEKGPVIYRKFRIIDPERQ